MCGRYALYGPSSRMREQFGVEPDDWQDRYNIAPDQGSPKRPNPLHVPILRQGPHGREFVPAQWWLLPYWSKERFVRYSTFNARIETVEKAAAFREPFKRRRCILPASGFYEWQTLPGGKQAWFMRPANADYFGLAGLWDQWRHGDEVVKSCTILVCDPDDTAADIHDRQPVILAPELYADWLDPELTEPTRVLALLHANPGVSVLRYKVGAAVNDSRHDGPELSAPLDPP